MYIIRKDNLRGNASRKQAVNFSKVLLSPSHWLGKLFTSPQLSTVFSDSRWRPDEPMGDPLAPPKSAYTAARPLFFPPRPQAIEKALGTRLAQGFRRAGGLLNIVVTPPNSNAFSD